MKYLITGKDLLDKTPNFKLIGRDDELNTLISILMRGKSNSVILTGSPGSGCSALCMGLQHMKSQSDAPFDIVAKRLFWLDIDELFKSGKSETITKNFETICSTLDRTSDSILIIPNMKEFLNAISGRFDNFMHKLSSMIRNNKTQVIIEAKDEDLAFIYKNYADFVENFTLMDLAEPKQEHLYDILKNSAKGLENHHRIAITEAAIRKAIELTTKYRSKDVGLSKAQPERSTTLLDRSLSAFRLQVHSQHPEVYELQRQKPTSDIQAKIQKLQKEYEITQADLREAITTQREAESEIFALEQAIDEQKVLDQNNQDASGIENFNEMGVFESDAVVALRKKIKEYEKVATENKKRFENITSKINEQIRLSDSTVSVEFAKLSGMSVDKLNQDETNKLLQLENYMKGKIFGQNHAVHQLSEDIKVARVGRRNGDKPQTAFLFLGPSGVGKTEIAKVLSEYLLDDVRALTIFDMSEYMEKHSVAKLIGAPPGYEGFEVGGLLTNAMRKNPHRIILFDEIEKAHPDVFNLFLQILGDGRLTDNIGRTVHFNDSIILMTTNIGQPFFLDDELSEQEAKEKAIHQLSQEYKSEFLNRFNGRENIVCFNKLEIDSIIKIVQREITKINDAYSGRIQIEVSKTDVENFCKEKYNPIVGARGLPGFIKRNLESKIANLILAGKSGTYQVAYRDGGFEL